MSHLRRLQGVVISDKMTKTRVIAITRLKKHPKYQKYYKVTKTYKAHDEENQYRTGDKVTIEESRPLSREKRWVIIAKVKGHESGVKSANESLNP